LVGWLVERAREERRVWSIDRHLTFCLSGLRRPAHALDGPTRPPDTRKKHQTVYRYLLFKSSREELVKDVDELKKKITGEL
jgi:hypothetical protein